MKECGNSNQKLLFERKVKENREKTDKQLEGVCFPPCHEPTKEQLRVNELVMKKLQKDKLD